jgi:non-ribosomal peptide synthetase component F
MEGGTVEYDLSLLMAGEAEGLGGSFVYNRDLFTPAFASKIVSHLKTVLDQVVADPNTRLLDIPLLDDQSAQAAPDALHFQLRDQAEQFNCEM